MKQHISKDRVDYIDRLVGEQLKRRRVLLGYSQEDLGKVANVSVQQIQKYESSYNRISSRKLYDFAKFLDVPVDYFFKADNCIKQTPFLEEMEKYPQNSCELHFENDKETLIFG